MRPPICEVCNERFDPADGELIRFVDDEASRAFDDRAAEPGFVGHRPTDGWFCGAHRAEARTRSASMTLAAALRDMNSTDR